MTPCCGAGVAGYESLIEAMTNDPKDRHVLGAAVRANAEAIVTFNTSPVETQGLPEALSRDAGLLRTITDAH